MALGGSPGKGAAPCVPRGLCRDCLGLTASWGPGSGLEGAWCQRPLRKQAQGSSHPGRRPVSRPPGPPCLLLAAESSGQGRTKSGGGRRTAARSSLHSEPSDPRDLPRVWQREGAELAWFAGHPLFSGQSCFHTPVCGAGTGSAAGVSIRGFAQISLLPGLPGCVRERTFWQYPMHSGRKMHRNH